MHLEETDHVLVEDLRLLIHAPVNGNQPALQAIDPLAQSSFQGINAAIQPVDIAAVEQYPEERYEGGHGYCYPKLPCCDRTIHNFIVAQNRAPCLTNCGCANLCLGSLDVSRLFEASPYFALNLGRRGI